ncbi:GerAB/ArcD/ProY family transporter [Fictibacillus halophilus]|uniref:GerAB/ArcD/ProY family transporter n=1 Tax=Fictibacillus halophilus TaxID=1610490 RepID=UPI00362E64A2
MQVNIRHQVSPYLLFFIIVASQIGIGVVGFHRIIAKYAGYDAWISVLIAGAVTQLIVWIMFHLLKSAGGDIVEVHKQMFGKKIGGGLSGIIMVYYTLAAVSVLRGYIEVIQVWMFPTLPTWILASLILLLTYYITSGGFRVIAGICFVTVIYSISFYTYIFHLPNAYTHWDNLLPVFDHSFIDLLKSARASSYSLAGFEVLLMVFPFIRNVNKSQKFAHLGLGYTTILYTISAVTTFLFVSEKQLDHTIWARFYIIKLLRFSFIERFEYILISLYLINIVAILTLLFWASSRGMKLIMKTKQRNTLIPLLLVVFLLSELINDRYVLNRYIDSIAQASIGLFYLYIPLLWILFILKKRREER